MQSKPSDNSCPSQSATSAPTGITCPGCLKFIPISIYQILHEDGITCPYCKLSLNINKSQSKQAQDALKKVEEAAERLRKTEQFKR